MDRELVRLKAYVLILGFVMLVGTMGLMWVENLSFVDSLYFGVVTIATVGYGDIHPTTTAGKVLTVILIITGVGTFLGVIAGATEVLLNRRDEALRRQKQHMVVGLFFSEVGTQLLRHFTTFDTTLETCRGGLRVTADWQQGDFVSARKAMEEHAYGIDTRRGDLTDLRTFLVDKSSVLLRLLENPSLLERESFTELLRAVFHLREELMSRANLADLPDTDRRHLTGDIRRAYAELVRQWLDHMAYLKTFYPYLFSLAMRMNPFDPEANPVVR